MYQKINKRKAKRLFNEGINITLTPSNCGPQYMWSVTINKSIGDFEELVNSFWYYNTNKELGYRVHYYIKEDKNV